jgi:type I restriction enzyme S subunit
MTWYGTLPTHWEARKINDLFLERREKVSDTDYAPLSVSKGGVVPQIATVAKSNAGDNRKLVRKGDFAINSRSDRRGSSGVSGYDGYKYSADSPWRYQWALLALPFEKL